MDSRDDRAQSILQRVLKLPTADQLAMIDGLCGDDDALRQRVEQLLASGLDSGPATNAEIPRTQDSDGVSPAMPATDGQLDFPRTETAVRGSSQTEAVVIAGRYHLRRKLGEGGMGEVWYADQTAPVKRAVAVKLIKAGMDSTAVIQRFEQERQALAMMDHPNIARVLDGGVTEQGQPYFVMELVKGLPLTKFADKAKLTPNERLELFVPVCAAIQHAHQKGIIHRDLKPANILVTTVDDKPIAKVIDFGVAKATGGKLTDRTLATEFGAVVGTLEYMSPEQAGQIDMDIDTRADIYSLGVVLYELLTGLRPIDAMRFKRAGLAEMIRIVQEEDPSKPSTRLSNSGSLPSMAAARRIDPKKLTSLLRGELDWVVMKCLEKPRERRYESASALGRDISRYLNDEAVEARPPSATYRFKKWVRRHRGAAVTAALVLAAILLGFAGTAWGLVQARRQTLIAIREADAKEQARTEMVRQRDRAIRSEQVAKDESSIQKAINQFLQEDILAQASTYSQSDALFQPDPDLTVKTALDRASDTIDDRFPNQPVIAAAIHRTIGEAYDQIGEFPRAKKHLRQALELSREHLGDEHLDTLQALSDLGYLLSKLEEFERSEQMLTEANEIYQRLLGPDDRESLRARLLLMACLQSRGARTGDEDKTEAARTGLIRLIADQKRVLGERDPDVWKSMNSLAMLYQFQGSDHNDRTRLIEAEAKMMEVMELSKELPDNHYQRLHYLSNLALIASDQLKFDKALALREKVLAGCRQTFGDQHPNTIRALDGVADMYVLNNRLDEAERFYLTSLAARRQTYGDDHSRTEHAIFELAQFYFNHGNWPKAEVYYRERLERNKRLRGNDSINTHLAARDLALVCMNLNQNDEALTLLSDAVVGLKTFKPDDDPIVMLTREYQADLLAGLGRFEEAIPIYRKAIEVLRSQPTPPPIELAQSLAAIGQAWLNTQQYREAETALREAHDLFVKYIPEAWPRFVYQYQTGVALAGQEKFEEAERLMLEGYEGQKKRIKAVPRDYYLESLEGLAAFYELWGKPEKAKQWQDAHSAAIAER